MPPVPRSLDERPRQGVFVIPEYGKEGFIMQKKNIYLMYAISCLQGMVFYGPIATLYRQAQGVSVFEITLIESISLVLCLALELPWGIVADKIGYKKTMVFCCLLYLISKVIFWRAEGFPAFLLERILLSVVMAGLSGVDTSILYLSSAKENSQKVFGIYNGLGTAGLLLAAMVYSVAVGADYRIAGFLTVISYGAAAAGGIIMLRTAFGLFSPLQTKMQNEQIMSADRATALSINAVIIDSVGVGTNLAFGAFAEKNLTAALLAGACLCAVGLKFTESMGKAKRFSGADAA